MANLLPLPLLAQLPLAWPERNPERSPPAFLPPHDESHPLVSQSESQPLLSQFESQSFEQKFIVTGPRRRSNIESHLENNPSQSLDDAGLSQAVSHAASESQPFESHALSSLLSHAVSQARIFVVILSKRPGFRIFLQPLLSQASSQFESQASSPSVSQASSQSVSQASSQFFMFEVILPSSPPLK